MSTHANFKNRTGEKYLTKEGYEIEIIKYTNSLNCTIKFNDERETVINKAAIKEIKSGSISNPYHPSVCGVGYYGVGKYVAKIGTKNTIQYQTWRDILKRCYNQKHQEKVKTYKDCSVDNRWHNFQVFAEWYDNNVIVGWKIDKDILFKGNRIYSSEKCIFVPNCINVLFTSGYIRRGKYPVGVSYKPKINKYVAQYQNHGKVIYLGYFTTPEEAFYKYKEVKENHIKIIAEEWKSKIDPRVYEIMYNHKINITD